MRKTSPQGRRNPSKVFEIAFILSLVAIQCLSDLCSTSEDDIIDLESLVAKAGSSTGKSSQKNCILKPHDKEAASIHKSKGFGNPLMI